MANPLARDLDHILYHTAHVWPELRDQRIFITGGTGFFGCWLLESFAWANDKLNLNAQAVALTRNAARFRSKAPHLAAHPAIRLHAGDVRDFDFPSGGFSHVIHAATESASGLNERDPLAMIETIVDGTRRVLDFAVVCGARDFLLTSSGAVYGQQPPDIARVPEDYPGAPETVNARSAYAEGKRIAELLCSVYNQRSGLNAKIARCFAFVGPYLPLDAHFAIGNFIGDCLGGQSIEIRGDGTAYRGYLYAADLAIWLWTILARGKSLRPYNVGSEEAISIKDLAFTVREMLAGMQPVRIAGTPRQGVPAERYVAETARARNELGLEEHISLKEGIRRTAEWHCGADKAELLASREAHA